MGRFSKLKNRGSDSKDDDQPKQPEAPPPTESRAEPSVAAPSPDPIVALSLTDAEEPVSIPAQEADSAGDRAGGEPGGTDDLGDLGDVFDTEEVLLDQSVLTLAAAVEAVAISDLVQEARDVADLCRVELSREATETAE